jgi:ligand-binding SRPBCC domain-containing protein
MRFEDSILIAASVRDVWAMTVAVDGLPAITPTISSVARLDDGPLTVGSRVKLKPSSSRSAVWTVTELDAPRRFVWESQTLGVRTVATHELEPVEDGTRQTLRVQLGGRGAALMASMTGSRIAGALAAQNAGFRERAEGR